jgi:spermidine/putrescine transport system substrate-binding protein
MTDLRHDPMFRQMVRSQLTRRSVLRGAGGVSLAAFLAACGTDAGTVSEEDRAADKDLSDTEKALNVSNWPLYIDVSDDESSRPTLEAFEEQTGISVKYTEDINDNTEFFGKVRNQLSDGQDTGRDLMVLTDWMAARMIRLGWAQQIDKANTPSFPANLTESLKSPEFDSDRDFTAPWQSGLTGIAYNENVTEPVKTIDELLTRPDLKGKVTVLSEMRDTMGLMLTSMGKDPASFTADDFGAAIDKLQKAVDSGQIRKFTGNEYAQDLAKGNIAAAIAWSGDVIQLQFDDPKIRFEAPESGLMLWSDNMLIPNKAQHKKNAEKWIDYYYQPEVAAELAAWVNFICPVVGAQEAMQDIDPELAANPLIFPDAEIESKAKVFRGLDADEEREFEDMFAKVTGA